MWGVILFIKFGWCVGKAGTMACIGAVLLSGFSQLLAASSLSAVATNGIVTRAGGEKRIFDSEIFVICPFDFIVTIRP